MLRVGYWLIVYSFSVDRIFAYALSGRSTLVVLHGSGTEKNAKPLVLTLRGTKLSLSGTGRHSSCMINIPSQVWNSY